VRVVHVRTYVQHVTTATETYEHDRAICLAACRAAAAVALDYRGRWQALPAKGINNPVTEADVAAQKAATAIIVAAFPDDMIVGEETAGDGAVAPDGVRCWVIDPIDGTNQYMRDFPTWCSAVALQRPDGTMCCAIEAPMIGRTFEGDTAEPKKPTPETRPTDRRPLNEACVGSYLSPKKWATPSAAMLLTFLVRSFGTLGAYGSGGFELAHVASGQLEGWIQPNVKVWDWLPGKALVEAAGGTTDTVVVDDVTWRIAGRADVVDKIASFLRAL
jgi:myo-inositol-1(or 4)-monophosphatase